MHELQFQVSGESVNLLAVDFQVEVGVEEEKNRTYLTVLTCTLKFSTIVYCSAI